MRAESKGTECNHRGPFTQVLHRVIRYDFSHGATQRYNYKCIPIAFISLIPRKLLFGKNQKKTVTVVLVGNEHVTKPEVSAGYPFLGFFRGG